ncbi:MAG TPA: hypothetical protein VGV93_02950 [Acidimicrobiales bacterium]|nr:hypothetical protein [Acidimicrobiales bacterium]
MTGQPRRGPVQLTKLAGAVLEVGEGLGVALADIGGLLCEGAVNRTLSAICSAAVRDRAIGSNPCDGVVLPRQGQAETVPPTLEESGCFSTPCPSAIGWPACWPPGRVYVRGRRWG